MSQKKKALIEIAVGLVLAAVLILILYKLPFSLVETGEGHSPQIMEVTLAGEEVTDRIDAQALLEVLSQARCRRNVFPHGTFGYHITDDLITIWVRDVESGMSREVFLSPEEQNFYNGNAYRWEHAILNGEDIYQQVLALIPERQS